MNKRSLKAFINDRIMPRLCGFQAKQSVVYQEDTTVFLKGFYFEISRSVPSQIAVSFFIQPLYVPADTFVLNFGARLGDNGDKWWDFQAQAPDEIASDIVERARRIQTDYFGRIMEPNEFPKNALGTRSTIHFMRAAAYSLCFSQENSAEVEIAFNELFKKAREIGLSIDWVARICDDAETLLNLYRDDSCQALRSLRETIELVRDNLGVSSD